MRQAGVSAILQELIPGGDDSFFGCFCYIDQAGEVRRDPGEMRRDSGEVLREISEIQAGVSTQSK